MPADQGNGSVGASQVKQPGELEAGRGKAGRLAEGGSVFEAHYRGLLRSPWDLEEEAGRKKHLQPRLKVTSVFCCYVLST